MFSEGCSCLLLRSSGQLSTPAVLATGLAATIGSVNGLMQLGIVPAFTQPTRFTTHSQIGLVLPWGLGCSEGLLVPLHC